MDDRCRHLFVYGTLMARAVGSLGKAQRDRLARECRHLGAASLTGARLYDLGRYPGLVESADPAEVVHGEVVELLRPARTLAWLDEYEEVVPDDPARSAYARLARSVRLASGPKLTAWVYVLLRDVAACRPIAGGRW